ncbi:hypothetical protein [Nonomuraea sp. GTA35]|uniref:hypothetical protein n=1 Tax=Nonomuraea sp. GTA35 TaxID=1676746 RepID=UPI0035C262C5
MTDPITCPECEGSKGTRLGRLFLACQFCGGTGQVGGDNEPAERGDQPPPSPPPAWRHKVWTDPWIASQLGCRYCLGSRQVAHVENGHLVSVPCQCVSEEAG